MSYKRSRRHDVALTGCALLLSACASAAGTSTGTTPGQASESLSLPTSLAVSTPDGSTASSTPPAESVEKPPNEVSTLPVGTYRVAVTENLTLSSGVGDTGVIGTWTVVVTPGHYVLQCRSFRSPSHDCGGDGKPGNNTVEIGFLRGHGSQVWFVHDPVATATLCGSVNGQIQCPTGGYRMTWTKTKSGLAFTDWVGLGDEANPDWTLNPWTLRAWTRLS